MKVILYWVFAAVIQATPSMLPIEFHEYRGPAADSAAAELRCRVAKDQTRMVESLTHAKWSEKDFPSINWEIHSAIIVAPQIYLQGYRLKVRSVTYDASTVILEWSLIEGAPDLVPETTGPRVSTHGSTAIGPEILVVSVPRANLSERKVVCRGLKKAEP